MKKAALAGIAALTLMDISAATPIAAQGINSFIGPYAGAHAGVFTGDATFKSAPYTVSATPGGGGGGGPNFIVFPGRNDSFDFNGTLAGVHGGWNFLLGTNFIGGLEGDLSNLDDTDFVSASGPIQSLTSDGFSFQRRSQIDLDWQGTIRGRLGFVAGSTLFFATAGVAFLNVDWSETTSVQRTNGANLTTLSHSDSDTLVGGAVGGGVEIAITPTVIFGADYLYENFGSFNSVPHGFVTVQSGKIDDLDIHKVRIRLSIKFGGPPAQ